MSTQSRVSGRARAPRRRHRRPPSPRSGRDRSRIMLITKKAIPRRTMLRGLGATLALPLLDAMVPALTALQNTAAKPITRFGVMYVPNGMVMEQWTPAAEGAGFELTPTLAPLAPFRDDLLVLSNLACVPTPGRPGGAHAKASTRFLTDVSPPTSETWLDAGISMDQILARQTGRLHAARRRSSWRSNRARPPARATSGSRARTPTRSRGWAQHAAADREQSARGVRAAVRRQRQHRSAGAARAHPPGPQRARLGPRGSRAPAGCARAERPREADRVSRRDPRRRAPHPEGRRAERQGAAASSNTRRASRRPTTSTCG